MNKAHPHFSLVPPIRVSAWILTLLLAALAFFAQGCGLSAAATPAAPFLAPTAVPTLPPTTAAVEQPTLQPTQPQDCTDVLSFMSDLTIPDGTTVQPGSTLDKRWQVRNNGTCNWQAGYHLRLIGGPDLGAPSEQALYPIRSGQAGVIRIEFTAPAESGSYRSAWQAFNQNDEAFGDPVFIDIIVSP